MTGQRTERRPVPRSRRPGSWVRLLGAGATLVIAFAGGAPGASAANSRPLPPTPGGTLAGTYTLRFPTPHGSLCDLGLGRSPHLLSVAGPSVTITDPAGPYTGKATREGKGYFLKIEQWSNYVGGPLTIRVTRNGARVFGKGKLTLYASGAAGAGGPCTLVFTGRRTSREAAPGTSGPPPTTTTAPVPLPPSTTSATTAPPPTTSGAATGGPPCTNAAITAGISAVNPELVSVNSFGCSGAYAYAGITEGSQPNVYDAVVVLQATGSQWAEADRGAACTSGAVPADIYTQACTTS